MKPCGNIRNGLAAGKRAVRTQLSPEQQSGRAGHDPQGNQLLPIHACTITERGDFATKN
jgi:hypothetical protein